MFTGIVETMGLVASVDTAAGFELLVLAPLIVSDVHLGDSIAIEGVCLTVTEFSQTHFRVGISPETLRLTNLRDIKVGAAVNLERAMTPNSRFGGHSVQGHVDTTAIIVSIIADPPNAKIYTFTISQSFLPLVVLKGYVCIDGTSLTVTNVDLDLCQFSIMMIEYTQAKVTLNAKLVGQKVNVEVDQMGKYIQSTVVSMLTSSLNKNSRVEDDPIYNAIRAVCLQVMNNQT